MRHDFADGKYTVINDNGKLTALRHGEPWARDLCGDNLVYWMLVEVDRLKTALGCQASREGVSDLDIDPSKNPHDPTYAGATPIDLNKERDAFEEAALALFIQRREAGMRMRGDDPEVPATRESVFWRDERGEYGVKAFNAAWWAWQERAKLDTK